MRYFEAEQEFHISKVANGFILRNEQKIQKPDNDYDWLTTTFVFATADEALAKGVELLKGLING